MTLRNAEGAMLLARHRVIRRSGDDSTEKTEQFLNHMHNMEGWELVSVVSVTSSAGEVSYRFFFRKWGKTDRGAMP